MLRGGESIADKAGGSANFSRSPTVVPAPSSAEATSKVTAQAAHALLPSAEHGAAAAGVKADWNLRRCGSTAEPANPVSTEVVGGDESYGAAVRAGASLLSSGLGDSVGALNSATSRGYAEDGPSPMLSATRVVVCDAPGGPETTLEDRFKSIGPIGTMIPEGFHVGIPSPLVRRSRDAQPPTERGDVHSCTRPGVEEHGGDEWEDVAEAFEYPDMNQLLRAFRRATGSTGGALDVQRARVAEAVRQSNAGSAWFTSKPLQAAVSKGATQVILLLLAVVLLQKGISMVLKFPTASRYHAARLRLEILELRNGASPAKSAAMSTARGEGLIAGMGLLLGGCPALNADDWAGDANNSSYVAVAQWEPETDATGPDSVVYSSRIGTVAAEGDGYFFKTPERLSPATDPVRWVLYASPTVTNRTNSTDDMWVEVGASGWLNRVSRPPVLLPEFRFEVQTDRGYLVKVDMRPAWPDTIVAFTGTLDWAACLLACVAAGRAGRAHWVRPFVVTIAAAEVVALLSGTAGFLVRGDPSRRVVSPLLSAIAPAALALCALHFQRHIVAALVVCGLALAAAETVSQTMFPSPETTTLQDIFLSDASAVFVLALAVVAMRRRAVLQARALVRADSDRYHIEWNRVIACADAPMYLAEMQNLSENLLSGSLGCIRQLCHSSDLTQLRKRRLERSSISTSFASSMAGSLRRPAKYLRAVNSLDQLYMQAELLHPIFLGRVQGWARLCGGQFVLSDSNRTADLNHHSDHSVAVLTQYAALSEEGRSEADFKFARIKSEERAIEKIERAYAQDASKLVDICRQCIVFDDISGIISCLRIIGRDPEAMIHRIKNRMRSNYNTAFSAGYRDVSLNLSLSTPESRGLGVDGHVCELQLLLLSFAVLKSDAGHKRYVVFRQLRGE